MTVTLDFPPAISTRISEEARRNDESVEVYLKGLILASMPKPQNGAEQLAMLEALGIVGLWEGREDLGDSVEFARRLRENAERRDGSLDAPA